MLMVTATAKSDVLIEQTDAIQMVKACSAVEDCYKST